MHVTASELNKHSGRVMNKALQQPVIIDKSGQPTVVMMSYDLFQFIKDDIEDRLWGYAAQEADKTSDFIGIEATNAFLTSK